MQIFVRTAVGKTVTLDVEGTDTIADVKAKIHDKEGLDPAAQCLLFDGAVLPDGDSLSELKIHKECTIDLMDIVAEQKEEGAGGVVCDGDLFSLELAPGCLQAAGMGHWGREYAEGRDCGGVAAPHIDWDQCGAKAAQKEGATHMKVWSMSMCPAAEAISLRIRGPPDCCHFVWEQLDGPGGSFLGLEIDSGKLETEMTLWLGSSGKYGNLKSRAPMNYRKFCINGDGTVSAAGMPDGENWVMGFGDGWNKTSGGANRSRSDKNRLVLVPKGDPRAARFRQLTGAGPAPSGGEGGARSSSGALGDGFALCWRLMSAENEAAIRPVLQELTAAAEVGGVNGSHRDALIYVSMHVRKTRPEIWTHDVAVLFGGLLKGLHDKPAEGKPE